MEAKQNREPTLQNIGDMDSLLHFSQIDPEIFNYESWYEKAVCRDASVRDGQPNIEFMESFFTKDQVFLAKFACEMCPVSKHCLTWALIYDEQGVWGGTTEQERKAKYTESHVEFLRNAAIKLQLYYRKTRPTVA